MICYKDRTYCEYYQICQHGSECSRALTDEVREAAHQWWNWFMKKETDAKDVPIARYVDKPECYEEIING
jgi:hypothetical protein